MARAWTCPIALTIDILSVSSTYVKMSMARAWTSPIALTIDILSVYSTYVKMSMARAWTSPIALTIDILSVYSTYVKMSMARAWTSPIALTIDILSVYSTYVKMSMARAWTCPIARWCSTERGINLNHRPPKVTLLNQYLFSHKKTRRNKQNKTDFFLPRLDVCKRSRNAMNRLKEQSKIFVLVFLTEKCHIVFSYRYKPYATLTIS
jgi:hypothetical protein